MLATLYSAALLGIDAEQVFVEVNTGESGDPKLVLVGLPDTAVKESNDRVMSALGNSGFRKPWSRTTINLAPGDIRKEGPMYDLPIALGFLVATGQLQTERLDEFLIAGELSLSGATRPIRGALAIARMAKQLGKRGLLLPPTSAREAALVEGIDVYAISSLDEAYRFLNGDLQLERVAPDFQSCTDPGAAHAGDFNEIKGQHALRRAIEVAAAGGHNLLMIGPPGSGKSMVAKRIPTILPTPTVDESLEVLSIHSAAGHTLSGSVNFGQRPVRSPHHTISDVGLLGGGTIPGPGEISLAHHGILFLDELPEFKRSALEVLRQPLEDGFLVPVFRISGTLKAP